jgi:hypothetical protein
MADGINPGAPGETKRIRAKAAVLLGIGKMESGDQESGVKNQDWAWRIMPWRTLGSRLLTRPTHAKAEDFAAGISDATGPSIS